MASNHLRVEVLRRPLEFAPYTAISFTEALIEAGIAPSIGTVGDALDNALIESTIGLYKTELIDHDHTRSWTGRAEVKRETASWVHWYNTTRSHHSIGKMTPIEFEQEHHRPTNPATTDEGCVTEPPSNPGRFSVVLDPHRPQAAVPQPGNGSGQRVVRIVLRRRGRAEQPDPSTPGRRHINHVLTGFEELLRQGEGAARRFRATPRPNPSRLTPRSEATRHASSRQFESQPTEARGRYDHMLNARPDPPSGRSALAVYATTSL
jgi:hypothetical protein